MPSLLRILRKLPVKEELKGIAEFINRELMPFLGEVRSVLTVVEGVPSSFVDDDTFIGNISGGPANFSANPFTELDSESITYDLATKSFFREAISGDVVIPQNDNTATIQPGVITNAKLANMAAGTVKGRQIDAGSGAPVDLVGSELAEIIRFANVQTESLGGTFNNYALDPLADVLNVTATSTFSGLTVGANGRQLVISNGAAANSGITVDLLQFSTSSGSGRRFLLPKATALRLYPGDAVVFWYGFVGPSWCAIAPSKALYRANSVGLGVSRSRLNFLNGTSVSWTIADVSASDEVTITPNVVTDSISNTLLRNSVALSVIGRSANSTGDPADISAVAGSSAVLRESGNVLGFGTIANAGLANMAAGTVKGRQIDAGAGVPVDLTGAELAEIIRFSNRQVESVGGTLNDYALDPLADCLSITATAALSGLVQAVASSGRRIIVANGAAAGSGVTVDLINFSLSTGGNRILLPKLANVRLYPGDAIELQHGVTGNFWFTTGGVKAYYRTNSSGLGVSRGRINFVDGTSVAWTNTDVAASDEVTVTPNVIANSISNTLLRDSVALSVIGRSANSTGDPGDIVAANDGEVLRRAGTALGFGTIGPLSLAVVASSRAVPFWIGPIALTATGAAADDVSVFSANAPFAFRILRMVPIVTTGSLLGTLEARNATGGGGAAVSSTFGATLASDAPAITANLGLTQTIALNGTLVVRRSSGDIVGEVFFECFKT